MASIGTKYAWLRVARADVDWQHVSPVLLRQLNAMARSRRVFITIFSGYRTDAYSAAHGGFAGDPHTRHIAVDASVNGKPIGQVFSRADFKRFGLRTGNQPNFYQGKPDPSHVDLVGTANENSASTDQSAAPDASSSAGSTGSAEGAAVLPNYQPNPNVGASAVAPSALPPGTVTGSESFQEMWKLIASQPQASPATLDYASLMSGSG